jgi:hypothetical protein
MVAPIAPTRRIANRPRIVILFSLIADISQFNARLGYTLKGPGVGQTKSSMTANFVRYRIAFYVARCNSRRMAKARKNTAAMDNPQHDKDSTTRNVGSPRGSSSEATEPWYRKRIRLRQTSRCCGPRMGSYGGTGFGAQPLEKAGPAPKLPWRGPAWPQAQTAPAAWESLRLLVGPYSDKTGGVRVPTGYAIEAVAAAAPGRPRVR